MKKPSSNKTKRTKPPAQKAAVDKLNRETLKLIAATINDLADENGWAFLGDIGNLILKKQPNFDPEELWFSKINTADKIVTTI